MHGEDDILFCGDPHGHFDHIVAALGRRRAAAVVILGDLDLPFPIGDLEKSVRARGAKLFWIPGNHDSDTEATHDNLFHGGASDGALHATVREAGGVRFAGLGGVFRQSVWFPKNGDESWTLRSRDELVRATASPSRWRKGIPRKHTTTIFPEDVHALASIRADVLVTHEAPSSHRFGFAALDRIASHIGARVIVHGHQHLAYGDVLPNGVRVIGLEERGLRYLSARELVAARTPVVNPSDEAEEPSAAPRP